MAKKLKAIVVPEEIPEVVPEEIPEGPIKSERRDYRKKPFVVVIGSSNKILVASVDLENALTFINEEVPVNKQAKAFIGQFFPVTVEIETKVKLDLPK